MAKKGYVTQAFIVKCYRVACERVSRTEAKTMLKAEYVFIDRGWKWFPNYGWQCPGKKHRP